MILAVFEVLCYLLVFSNCFGEGNGGYDLSQFILNPFQFKIFIHNFIFRWNNKKKYGVVYILGKNESEAIF